MAVARLGHRRVQPQPAVRPVHHRAARRRSAAERDAASRQIATGFNRNHMQNEEGGIIAEEYRVEYVVDRVEHDRRRVWLGLTRRLRPLPRSQVRSDHAEGVLPALRVLQQRQRGRPDPYRACRARRRSSRRRKTTRSWRRSRRGSRRSKPRSIRPPPASTPASRAGWRRPPTRRARRWRSRPAWSRTSRSRRPRRSSIRPSRAPSCRRRPSASRPSRC